MGDDGGAFMKGRRQRDGSMSGVNGGSKRRRCRSFAKVGVAGTYPDHPLGGERGVILRVM